MTPGTVVRCYVNDMPFVYHYGIIATDASGNRVVLHNTPDEGGTVVSSWADFMQGRTLINSYKGRVTENNLIWQRFEQCKGKFNLFFYNCEHFIDAMQGMAVQRSQQVTFWVIFILAFLFIHFVYFN